MYNYFVFTLSANIVTQNIGIQVKLMASWIFQNCTICKQNIGKTYTLYMNFGEKKTLFSAFELLVKYFNLLKLS